MPKTGAARSKRPATARQLVYLARRVLKESPETQADGELIDRVKAKCVAWDLTWEYGHRLTSALASARFLEGRDVRKWVRTTVTILCGGCGKPLEKGSPVQLIELPHVTRKLKRGPCCAGDPPPDLPTVPAPKQSTTKKMTPLLDLLPRNWKLGLPTDGRGGRK